LSIERIFIRPPGGNPTVEQRSVRVVAGAGIEGDRYFDAHDEPGQNITFVEAEEIEAFAQEHRRPADLSATGRNVITRGVRLNELVGREFMVGAVRFRGIELCEPCLTLGEALASPTLSPARVVKHWVRRGGLRADALTSGELSVGAGFQGAA
jgi:MOSC domain-containing protein YiiM